MQRNPNELVRQSQIAEIVASYVNDGCTDASSAFLASNNLELLPELEEQFRLAKMIHAARVAFENSDNDSHLAQTTLEHRVSLHCPECHSAISAPPLAALHAYCAQCGVRFAIARNFENNHSVGQRIGEFELVEQVGIGSFGIVWKAHDLQLDRFVAIKVPKNTDLSDVEIERFTCEARAASRVRHPNIVAVHEVGRDGNTPYIVSDFIDGHSLRYCMDERHFSARESAELVETISLALQAVHDCGIVHRDMKPDNVLLDKKGIPFLADFGLAKNTTFEVLATTDGLVMGTPAYMSPEQARGDSNKADNRSDVYSLGVMLFQLLTEELPFRGSPHRILEQISNDDPPSLRKLCRATPPDLETICLRCLEKSPARRFPSAKELADELRRYLDGKPILSRRIGAFPRAARWARRNPFAAILIAFVCLSAVVGPVLAFHERSNAQRLRSLEREATSQSEIATNRANQAEKLAEAADLARRDAEIIAAVANRSAYSSHIARASSIYPGDWSTAGQLIGDETIATREQRGFEWRHLVYACDRRSMELKCHDAKISAMSMSSHSQLLATGDEHGKIAIWNVHDWSLRHVIETPHKKVLSLAFLPQTNEFISGGEDCTVRRWDGETGKEVRLVTKSLGRVYPLVISPDGKQLAFGSDGAAGIGKDTLSHILIVDIDGERTPQRLVDTLGRMSRITSLAFSPTGKLLVSSDFQTKSRLHIWDAETGKRIQTHTFDRGIDAACFSRDGASVLVGKQPLEKWKVLGLGDDISKQEIERQIQFVGQSLQEASSIATFADNSRIVVGGWTHIYSVDESTGALLWEAPVPGATRIGNLVASQDGRFVVASGQQNTAFVIPLGATQIFESIQLQEYAVLAIEYSTDSKHVFVGGDDSKVFKCSLKSGRIEWSFDAASPVYALSTSTDGETLAVGTSAGEVIVLQCQTGEVVKRWAGHTMFVSSLVHADSDELVSAGGDGRIIFWNAADQSIVAEIVCGPMVRGFDISSDGTWLASADEDRTVRIYDVPTRSLCWELKGHVKEVHGLAFQPKSSRLVSCSGSEWFLWDAASGALERKSNTRRTSGMRAIAFSMDGRCFATTEHQLTLWDSLSGSLLCQFDENLGRKSLCVQFAPDGRSIAYGQENGTLVIRRAVPPE